MASLAVYARIEALRQSKGWWLLYASPGLESLKRHARRVAGVRERAYPHA